MTKTSDQPELETLDYKPENQCKQCNIPKVPCSVRPNQQECDNAMVEGFGQPNQNLMIMEQVEGAVKVALGLLEQLTPRTDEVRDCIWTLNGWKEHNFKHLRKAFE